MPVLVTKVSQRRRWRGEAQQLRRRRAPGHVQCLLDTKQLPKWSSHSEAVEYPMLLLRAQQVRAMVRALRFYAWSMTTQHPAITGWKWVGIRESTPGGTQLANLVT